jgi:hypothetical protein
MAPAGAFLLGPEFAYNRRQSGRPWGRPPAFPPMAPRSDLCDMAHRSSPKGKPRRLPPYDVVVSGQVVGTFEYLAAHDDGRLVGFWSPASGPDAAAFLADVRAGQRPRVGLARLNPGARTPLPGTLAVLSVKRGRRWRRGLAEPAEPVQVITLSPPFGALAGGRMLHG